METISAFYSVEFEGKQVKPPIKEKNKQPQSPSLSDVIFDTFTYKGEFYENRFEELDTFNYYAKLYITKNEEYSGRFTKNFFNEIRSETGEEYLVEIYLYRGEIRGLRVIDENGIGETIFGGDWIASAESQKNLLDPFMTKVANQMKITDPSKLSFAVPEFTSKVLHASAKATFGGSFTKDHEIKDSIEKFNRERPGSDSKFDKGYKEMLDRIEGKSGWINV